jgi:O-antigen/teichoic acid export membrane protein
LEKTAGGAGWTIGWRATTRALGFLSTLVLARILVPADFGVVALAMSFLRALDILTDLGVQEALVRASTSRREAYDTAFTIMRFVVASPPRRSASRPRRLRRS